MANKQEIDAFQDLMKNRQAINEMMMGATDLNAIKNDLLFEENKQFMAMQRFCLLQSQHFDPRGPFNARRFFGNGLIIIAWVLFTIVVGGGVLAGISRLPPGTADKVLSAVKGKLPGGMAE